MATAPLPESRRFDIPPLWAVPGLLLAAISAIFYVGLTFGALGFIVGLFLIAWLQPRADAYVRAATSLDDRARSSA